MGESFAELIIKKFWPRKKVVELDLTIKERQQARESIQRIGRLCAEMNCLKSAELKQIQAIQKQTGDDVELLEDEISRELTRLKEFGLTLDLHKDDGPKTASFDTGTISFKKAKVRVSYAPAKTKDIKAALKSNPELKAKYLVFDADPSINRGNLAESPADIKKVNELLGEAVIKLKRKTYFRVALAGQTDLQKDFPVSCEYKDEVV